MQDGLAARSSDCVLGSIWVCSHSPWLHLPLLLLLLLPPLLPLPPLLLLL
jgi:hypothetical protein